MEREIVEGNCPGGGYVRGNFLNSIPILLHKHKCKRETGGIGVNLVARILTMVIRYMILTKCSSKKS